jgi:hypothetical protein
VRGRTSTGNVKNNDASLIEPILATPATADEMTRILETVGRGERVEHYETERRRKDRQVIQVALTISPIRDDTGGLSAPQRSPATSLRQSVLPTN